MSSVRKRGEFWWLGALVALGLASSCAKTGDPEPKPPAPDVSETVEAFDNPTLDLDDGTGEEILNFVQEATDLLEELELEDQVLDPIYEALEEEPPQEEGAAGAGPIETTPAQVREPLSNASRQKSQPLTLEGDGFLRVTRVCEGWEEPVVDEEKNGSIQAIVGFTDAGLDPVMWGDMTRCRYSTDAGDVLLENGDGALDAGMALYVGEDVAPEDFGEEPILFIFNLDSTLDGEPTAVRLAFRHNRSTGLYEFLYELPEGSLVLLVEEGNLLGVRAANGEYTCEMEPAVCTDADGSTVELR